MKQITQNPYTVRIISLLVAEAFLFSGLSPSWASSLTYSHLRPIAARDGANREDLFRKLKAEVAEEAGTQSYWEEKKARALVRLFRHPHLVRGLSPLGFFEALEQRESEELGEEKIQVLLSASRLTERERIILEARLRIDPNTHEPIPYRAIGRSLGIVEEYVRQIEKKAIRKVLIYYYGLPRRQVNELFEMHRILHTFPTQMRRLAELISQETIYSPVSGYLRGYFGKELVIRKKDGEEVLRLTLPTPFRNKLLSVTADREGSHLALRIFNQATGLLGREYIIQNGKPREMKQPFYGAKDGGSNRFMKQWVRGALVASLFSAPTPSLADIPDNPFYPPPVVSSEKLNQKLMTEEELSAIMDHLFKEMPEEALRGEASRLTLFVGRVLKDKRFPLQEHFQRELLRLYDQSHGLNRYFIAALFRIYLFNFKYIERDAFYSIIGESGVSIPFVLDHIPFGSLFQSSGTLTVKVIFSDRDAEKDFQSMITMFTGEDKRFPRVKGYRVTEQSDKQVTLEKGNKSVRLILVRSGDGSYDITPDLKDPGVQIIMSRSRAGGEAALFKAQPVPQHALKIYVASDSHSITAASRVYASYPNAIFLGMNDVADSDQSNLFLFYLAEGLMRGLKKRDVTTWSALKIFVRSHSKKATDGFIFPGEPAEVINHILAGYRARARDGGVRAHSPLDELTFPIISSYP